MLLGKKNDYVFPDSIKFIKLMSSLEIMDTKWAEILKKLEKNFCCYIMKLMENLTGEIKQKCKRCLKMKKVSIIYWSNGGNVEVLANAISEGVIESEAKVDIKYVADATIEDILEADAVALGSPAMLNDEIEEVDMKPFINSLSELEINNKPLVLFGSCGWRDTKFIDKWGDLMVELLI